MTQRSIILSNNYQNKIARLERTRRRIESLYSNGALIQRETEQVYEALFISSITAFEALLEDLFFGLMMRRLTSGTAKVRCKIDVSSEVVGRDIILAGKSYLEWLPYNNTEDRASRYFASGLPFSKLGDGHKSMLQQCIFIRNAIAHKSSYAINTYKNKVLGTMALLPRERAPASFLRSQFRASPYQCRYENYIAQLVQISWIICK